MLFTCYLPPETSVWGKDASFFFNHVMSQIYLCSEVEAILVCGDFNSRIGAFDDYLKEVDAMPPRAFLDGSVNKHGESMIEFLKESKLCIVNGRICPLSDNFTSVSIKGEAVVDYILVPYDCLQICDSFEVLVSNQIVWI